jgi:arsenite methyltransferase
MEQSMSDKPLQSNLDPSDAEAVVRTVRERYAGIATAGSSCCGGGTCGDTAEAVATNLGYASVDLNLLPGGANLGLGCGAPLEHLNLEEGEAFLDLGSGAGIDALIAARQVGPAGRVIGVDMTPAMLGKGIAGAKEAGLDNVKFRPGFGESLPVDDDWADVLISNGVLNLMPDKAAALQEMARVLKPGGRLQIGDILVQKPVSDAVKSRIELWTG